MYIVYTCIDEGEGMEYWYHGRYDTLNKALSVAAGLDANGSQDVYHNTCTAEEVKRLGINNLPADLR